MVGEVWRLPADECQVVAVYKPVSLTTTLVATYGRGFGDDPLDRPGVAHLHEHLFLDTLRRISTNPLIAQARTDADSMRVTVTVREGAERELVNALADTADRLASSPVPESVKLRECRAIDVELAEWFGNHTLIVGHKVAAVATRRGRLGRFDDCRPGDSAGLSVTELLNHARSAELLRPRQIVVVSSQPAVRWQDLLDKMLMPTAVTRLPVPAAPPAHADPDEGRMYIGIPLPSIESEAALVSAECFLDVRGPLNKVSKLSGAQYRGGSILPTSAGAVICASWLTESIEQRESIKRLMGCIDGDVGAELIEVRCAELPNMRAMAATNSMALAVAVDGWQSGYGINPTADKPPNSHSVDNIMRMSWERAILV